MENIMVAVMAVIKEKRSKASASAPFCRDSIVLLFKAMSATITYIIDNPKSERFTEQSKILQKISEIEVQAYARYQ